LRFALQNCAAQPIDEANSESVREQAGLIAKYDQRACHDTLPWLISFSLGGVPHGQTKGL
jgi:hypothetical protein